MEGEIYGNIKKPQIFVERTLAIIKPDAIRKCDEIINRILDHGFYIIQKKRVHLTPEEASDFYAEHFGKLFFPSLIAYVSSGPILVMILSHENAISLWRDIIGPTNALKAKIISPESLRAIYGTDDQQNGFHGSDSFSSAEREIRFFFPEDVIEPIPIGLAAKDYLARNVNPILLKGLTEMCKKKPENPLIWLADWLLENNPNKPGINHS